MEREKDTESTRKIMQKIKSFLFEIDLRFDKTTVVLPILRILTISFFARNLWILVDI